MFSQQVDQHLVFGFVGIEKGNPIEQIGLLLVQIGRHEGAVASYK
jgi:hypothetical protein